jgi:hypothetical protein
MVRRVLVRVTRRPNCGLVLRCVRRAVTALRRVVAGQVHGSKDPVAEEQCSHQEEEQEELLSGRARDHAVLQAATV